VDLKFGPGDLKVFPKFLSDFRDLGERLGEALFAPRHADVVPRNVSQLPHEFGGSLLPVDREELLGMRLYVLDRFFTLSIVFLRLPRLAGCQVGSHSVWYDEVTVGQFLHQAARTETI